MRESRSHDVLARLGEGQACVVTNSRGIARADAAKIVVDCTAL